jgi:uncharacterized protein
MNSSSSMSYDLAPDGERAPITKETNPSPFPWSYLALTFGFSWLIWLPAVLGHQGIIPFPADKYAEPLLFAGVFGPMFAASVLTYRAEGSQGLRRFLGRLVNVRFAAVWWIVIFALPLCVQAVAHFAPLLSGEAVQPSYISSVGMFLRIFLLVTFLGGGQEEVGWRSYALDRLQARFSALVSSLILGTFWAAWHFPLWFMSGTSQPITPFGAFFVMCLSLSVILTWIYNNTGKNMVAVILTHGMVNASHPLLPVIRPGSLDQHVYVYWAIALAVVAIIITALWGSASLTRTKGVDEARDVDVWDRCHS